MLSHCQAFRRKAWFAASLVGVACGGETSAPPAPTEIVALSIYPNDSLTVPVKDVRSLTALGRSTAGNLAVTPVAWRSSDERGATRASFGKVGGVGRGVVVITATQGALSAAVVVRVSPANLVISFTRRALPTGQALEFSADLFDASGTRMEDPVPIAWASTDELLARVEVLDPPLGRRVRLRAMRQGIVALTAKTLGVSDAVSITVRDSADVAPIWATEFFVGANRRSDGTWLYTPIVNVRTNLPGLRIVHIEIKGAAENSMCGDAPLQQDEDVPLFDFQPYNYRWIGPDPDEHRIIWVRLQALTPAGTTITVTAPGKVVDRGSTIYDYGTEGFPWTQC